MTSHNKAFCDANWKDYFSHLADASGKTSWSNLFQSVIDKIPGILTNEHLKAYFVEHEFHSLSHWWWLIFRFCPTRDAPLSYCQTPALMLTSSRPTATFLGSAQLTVASSCRIIFIQWLLVAMKPLALELNHTSSSESYSAFLVCRNSTSATLRWRFENLFVHN